MPHRALRDAMQQQIELQCKCPGGAERVVNGLARMGVRPPAPVVTEVADLDAIPDGAAVVVGDPRERGHPVRIGVKVPGGIMLAGEESAFPFRSSVAPPLPCMVVWVPGEDSPDSPSMGDRMGELARSILMQGLEEEKKA